MAHITKHEGKDWCHVCGQRKHKTVDIWYPKNAEQRDREYTEYIRICTKCTDIIKNINTD